MLNPWTLHSSTIWLSLAICPDIFLFISDDSSLILVEYLVHWVLRRDIRSRSSVNSASAKELSTVRYLLPGLPEFVASVLLLVVGLWVRPEVWSYNQFAGFESSHTSRIEQISYARILRAYCINSELVHDEMWFAPGIQVADITCHRQRTIQ